jgi:hypothetical protein
VICRTTPEFLLMCERVGAGLTPDRRESADSCSWPGANLMTETGRHAPKKGQVAIAT